jgi:ketosteroid isomerase-like protein
MKVYEPGDMNSAFAEAFNAGDIDSLMTLYEPSAVLFLCRAMWLKAPKPFAVHWKSYLP